MTRGALLNPQTILRSVLVFAIVIAGFGFLADGNGDRSAQAQIKDGGKDDKIRLGFADILGGLNRSLSGPLWLVSENLDPRMLQRPGSDALTRLDFGSLDAYSGFQAPQSQGGGGVLVPFRDPAPAFSRNVLLTRDFGNTPIQTEPSLAVDPKDPEHIVVGVIDFNFPSVAAYTSFDGGETWEGPFQTPFLRDDITGAGDPVVVFDSEGDVYMISISLGFEEFSVGNFELAALISSIVITKSLDGGLTWSDAISTSRSGVTTDLSLALDQRARGTVSISFLDKPWVDIGPDPDNPGEEIIYVSYTDFNVIMNVVYIDELPALATAEVQSTIRLVTSIDGRTWSEPVDVSPTVRRVSGDTPSPGTGNTTGLKRVVQGSSPKVAPDGTVYVAWMDSTDDESQEGIGEIYIARSEDGGKSFTSPIRATVFSEPGFRPRTSFFRYWASAFPQMAIGPDGAINIVYVGLNPERPVDDGDVYYLRSTDRGESWTRPFTLGGDRSTSLQFFPAIDVGPDGDIHVMWGDTRDSREQIKYHIYYTRSQDNGETWGFEDTQLNIRSKDARVTDFPSNPNYGFPFGLFIGDYFGIKATETDVYLIWADTRLGEFGPINQKIGFARRTSIPAPEIFLSPPAGPGGQEVTLQGFNLQPNLNVFIQAGGVTIANQRTDDQGRFTTNLFMPVTGKGAQTIRVLDESGNVATASFFTEFGFGDIAKGQDAIAEQLRAQGTSVGITGIDGGDNATEWWVIFLATIGGAFIAAIAASALTVLILSRRRSSW
ncbi:MAG: exo-alpha-sialidase [Chloroflexi bacterium]|nr:exo-alpha-sialidase [Chloroflexota bacterium]